jgi:histidine triad (HIT) family protein
MSNKEPYQPDNIFAKILRGEIPCYRVYEDELALAFLDIMPQADGHTLVIPKLAVRGLFDMPDDAWGPFMQRVQKVATAVKKGMAAEGLNLRQFDGAAGGQTVFHLHMHIVPRWEGVALRRHGELMEKAEVLKANMEKIRGAF